MDGSPAGLQDRCQTPPIATSLTIAAPLRIARPPTTTRVHRCCADLFSSSPSPSFRRLERRIRRIAAGSDAEEAGLSSNASSV